MKEKGRAVCNQCGFTAPPEEFDASMSAYHDLKCPKCGTTAVDTSNVKKDWEKRHDCYGFGNNNTLVMKKEGNE